MLEDINSFNEELEFSSSDTYGVQVILATLSFAFMWLWKKARSNNNCKVFNSLIICFIYKIYEE